MIPHGSDRSPATPGTGAANFSCPDTVKGNVASQTVKGNVASQRINLVTLKLIMNLGSDGRLFTLER